MPLTNGWSVIMCSTRALSTQAPCSVADEGSDTGAEGSAGSHGRGISSISARRAAASRAAAVSSAGACGAAGARLHAAPAAQTPRRGRAHSEAAAGGSGA